MVNEDLLWGIKVAQFWLGSIKKRLTELRAEMPDIRRNDNALCSTG